MTAKVKVRIALAVLPDGTWAAYGASDLSDEDAMQVAGDALNEVGDERFWIEAEATLTGPLPITGTVTKDDHDER